MPLLLQLQKQSGNRTIQQLLAQTESPAQAVRQGDAIAPLRVLSPYHSVQRQAVAPPSVDEKPVAKSASQSKWQDTPEQKAFLEAVLQAHIARSAKRRQPLPDLDGSELAPVSGTSVKMRADAAAAAGNLLAAASAALAAAKQAGDPDALTTVGLSATSGYRGRSHQEDLWRRYFKRPRGYYNRTAARRAALPGGEHGEAAVAYMVKYVSPKIAPPGFSNHQAGLAIDFWQARTKGNEIANSTDKAAVDKWQATWFFSWLQANAARYGFQEYAKEPWHWTYRGQGGGSAATTAGVRAAPGAAAGAPPAKSGAPTGAGIPPGERREDWLEHAVERNAALGPRLGWTGRVDEIVAHFQNLRYLAPLQTPDEETFARAVKRYQGQHPDLVEDGVLGPRSWRQLWADMGQLSSKAISETAEQPGSWLYATVLQPLQATLERLIGMLDSEPKAPLGLAPAAQEADQTKAKVEKEVKNTLQVALDLEQDLRRRNPKYGEEGGFQGYGAGKDRYVCTTFAQEVLKRAGYRVSGQVGKQINIAIDWQAETGAKRPTQKQTQEALAKLLEQGDVRLKGVVNALVSSGQGVEVAPEQLQKGDFVQYWYKSKQGIGGHVVQVVEVLSPGNKILAHGSHGSKRGVATITVYLKSKNMIKVYGVRPK